MYLVEYADFCHLIQQDAVVTLVIFGVTGLIFVNFAQDVGKYCHLLFLNWNWHGPIPISFGTRAYQ